MTSDFWSNGVAERFLQTRYMPRSVSEDIAREVISWQARRLGKRKVKVTEIGCGAGRLSRGYTSIAMDPRSDYQVEYVGLDHDIRMLTAAMHGPGRVAGEFKAVDCSDSAGISRWRADLVVVHWVANTTPRWEEIMRNAVGGLNEGGAILFLEEQSCLYNAIDGRFEGTGLGQKKVWRDFWETFYKSAGMAEERLGRRIGLEMDMCTVSKAWEYQGLLLRELDNDYKWERLLTPRWIADRVLVPRAFTNLRLLSAPALEKGLQGIEKLFSRYRAFGYTPLKVKYHARPIVGVCGG